MVATWYLQTQGQRGPLAISLGRPRDGRRDLCVTGFVSIVGFALLVRLGSRLLKRLLEICDDIINVLDTD